MKKIFEFLQQFAVAIALFFSASPMLLHSVAIELGDPYATWFSLLLALTGTCIFVLFLWYLHAIWQVPHRGYLIAVGFASIIGMILGWVSLAYLDGIIGDELQKVLVSTSFIFHLGVLWGFFIEWFTKPLKEEVGG
jgi:hypothetical protein